MQVARTDWTEAGVIEWARFGEVLAGQQSSALYQSPIWIANLPRYRIRGRMFSYLASNPRADNFNDVPKQSRRRRRKDDKRQISRFAVHDFALSMRSISAMIMAAARTRSRRRLLGFHHDGAQLVGQTFGTV